MSWLHYALLSALFAGVTAVLVKAGTDAIDPDLAMAVRAVAITLLAWVVVWLGGKPLRWEAFDSRSVMFLLLSALATALSWWCYFRAIHLGAASDVAPIDKLSVVFAIVLAALILGEHLTWRHYVGGSLMVVGAIIVAGK
jgi:transporter family protein